MQKRKCEVCGIEIVPKVKERRKQIYCSRKCSAKGNYIKHRDYYKSYWESKYRGEVESNCKICGKKFFSKNSVHYTCSSECSKKLSRLNKELWKKNNPEKVLEEQRIRFRRNQDKKISEIANKICPQCQKEFNPYNTRRNPYKTYCSKKCQQLSNSRKQTRERMLLLKNPDFASEKYCKALARKRVQDANYHAINRGCKRDDDNHISLKSWLEIKELHGNKCADCGKTENEEMKLTIDHIHPISKGGKNNKNNIQPLCRKCNSIKSAKIISVPHTSLN